MRDCVGGWLGDYSDFKIVMLHQMRESSQVGLLPLVLIHISDVKLMVSLRESMNIVSTRLIPTLHSNHNVHNGPRHF